METLYSTFQHIAHILSFDASENELKDILHPTQTDWDSLVKIASKHLVLPAIYCRLKHKNLLHLLPNDLSNYLDELTQINRNRNATLLKEAIDIHKLFVNHQINHVFIKGIALIAGDYFKDHGERMIGDIDILVHIDDLTLAFDLLLQNNYTAMETTISSKYFKDKHLPRLINSKKMGAIELHKNLFNQNKAELLNTNHILNQKRSFGGLNIPAPEYLLAHNILNYQINDHGYYFNSISLRAAYDSIIIINRNSGLEIASESKYISPYFQNLSVFFPEIMALEKGSRIGNFKRKLFKLKHKSKMIGKVWYAILKNYQTILLFTHRSFFFITNKSYRNDILNNPKRARKAFFNRIKSRK